MTFEPDPLTVPDSAPLNLSYYSLYYTPTDAGNIVNRAVDLLGLDASRVSVMGFGNESDMVDELLMQEEGDVPGCFVHGAGDDIHTHARAHTHTHTHTHTQTTFVHMHHSLDR